MSEVYVLVKQVSDKSSEGHFTVHGATEDQNITDTWTAAGEDCFSIAFDTEFAPTSVPWFVEEDSE